MPLSVQQDTCRHCNRPTEMTQEPAYCPNCGEEFELKKWEDIDFPLRVQVAPRIDVYRYVQRQTGASDKDVFSGWDVPSDYELLVDLIVHEDGSVDVDPDSLR